ncbi:MAG TPA: O-methyltransferase [Thermoanaerobaculia bacterium]|jgi:hypothetical protein
MSQPPYHLSLNKAVDRLLFVDAIRRLGNEAELQGYTYYSLGGPYLEDFRLMYEFFPHMKLVSVESDEEVFKRQQFHAPCANITLLNTELGSFINTYDSRDEKSIFWLDNTGLKYSHFDEFMVLLQKLSAGSMVKITLDASMKKFTTGTPEEMKKKIADFREKFELVLPGGGAALPVTAKESARFLQLMLRKAAERALPGNVPLTFQPVSSFYYTDTATMVTVTGVVSFRQESEAVTQAFAKWPFANLDWHDPRHIDLPVLTTKERLHLQRHLPCAHDSGRILLDALGYRPTTETAARTERQMSQYAEYHRYSPYFVRGVP